MEKNLNISELSDYYKGLLTERQYDIIDRYYNLDCSLGEIAESLGITRQSVRDSLVKSCEALERYESLLQLCKRSSEVLSIVDKALAECDDPKIRNYLGMIQKTIEG